MESTPIIQKIVFKIMIMDEIPKAEYSGTGPGGMPTEKRF